MHLTDGHHLDTWTTRVPMPPRWALAVIVLGIAAVFLVDRATGSLPFQHLYYLPIVLAGFQFGRRGAWLTSLAAVALYHLANPALLTFRHEAPDVVQIVLFVAIGLVTARLRDDAQRLAVLAGTDDLTGLHNLRAFERRLHDAVRHAAEEGTPLTVLVLDLDGLKGLNDVHGHLTGAEAVQTVGRIIRSTMPSSAIACRYGGDEFVIALPGTPVASAHDAAAATLQTVRDTAPTLAGRGFPPGTLSVSIGLASRSASQRDTLDDTGVDRVSESLFHAADGALYEAKRDGRGRIRVARTPVDLEPLADARPTVAAPEHAER